MPHRPRGQASPAVSWFSAVLRGEEPAWPDAGDDRTLARIWRCGLDHGVLALCHRRLRATSLWEDVPVALRRQLEQYTREQVATEMVEAEELEQVLDHLDAAGVSPLLMKGAPLAYTVYPRPHLRSRRDVDLLFPDRAQTDRALEVLYHVGYRTPNAIDGQFITHAVACVKTKPSDSMHALDLHWRISNIRCFADSLSFGDAERASVAIPRLGQNARGLGRVHALLLACMHRLAHACYGDENRLIWLYDIHLLVDSLSPREWHDAVSAARRRRIGGALLDGLRQSRNAFATEVPEPGLRELEAAAGREGFPLESMRSGWRVQLMNFRSLPDGTARLRLLREHLFPSAEYMLAKYRTRNRRLLPALYVVRLLARLFRFVG